MSGLVRHPLGIAAVLGLLLSPLALAAESTAGAAPAEGAKPLPVALVDALNVLSHGPHPGFRANHAKGIMIEGRFIPAATAAALSRAPHFAKPSTVVVRFSDGTGVPVLPDADPNASPHGMAIRFSLPGGISSDIVAISANGFPVATPEDFLAFLQAAGKSGPEAPKPTPIESFLAAHPAALKFVTTPRPPPASFATLAFYGVDAFKFTDSKGTARYARYQIIPAEGEHSLGAAEAKTAPADYLMAELPRRLTKGPVAFTLWAQVAEPGDSLVDPTIAWPEQRRRIRLGSLIMAKPAQDQAAAQRLIMFSPLNLTDGIEPSADPILLARPSAYGVSFSQRVQ
jgi:catalase